MSDAVTSVAQTPAAAEVGPPKTVEAAPVMQSNPVPKEKVSVSASAIQAALKEATETPAETAKEAGTGDVQAIRLLAKEAAAKAGAKEEFAHKPLHVVA